MPRLLAALTAGGPASHCHSLHPRWGALEEVDEMPEGLRVAFLEPRFREKEIAVDGPCEDWHWVLGAQVKGEVPDLQASGSGGRYSDGNVPLSRWWGR